MISIHALREEGDCVKLSFPTIVAIFLSTPSARRATNRGGTGRAARGISIHALREEGDLTALLKLVDSRISIHALREEGDEVGVDVLHVLL